VESRKWKGKDRCQISDIRKKRAKKQIEEQISDVRYQEKQGQRNRLKNRYQMSDIRKNKGKETDINTVISLQFAAKD